MTYNHVHVHKRNVQLLQEGKSLHINSKLIKKRESQHAPVKAPWFSRWKTEEILICDPESNLSLRSLSLPGLVSLVSYLNI